MPFLKGENPHRPAPGSVLRVEPILDKRAIGRIKKMLRDHPRDLCLFVLGMNRAFPPSYSNGCCWRMYYNCPYKCTTRSNGQRKIKCFSSCHILVILLVAHSPTTSATALNSAGQSPTLLVCKTVLESLPFTRLLDSLVIINHVSHVFGRGNVYGSTPNYSAYGSLDSYPYGGLPFGHLGRNTIRNGNIFPIGFSQVLRLMLLQSGNVLFADSSKPNLRHRDFFDFAL